MSGIDILGTGCYAPSHTLSNDDLSTMVDTSDEWIYPRTGIKSATSARRKIHLNWHIKPPKGRLKTVACPKKTLALSL